MTIYSIALFLGVLLVSQAQGSPIQARIERSSSERLHYQPSPELLGAHEHINGTANIGIDKGLLTKYIFSETDTTLNPKI